jgi:predicted DNA-binding protein
MRSVREETDLSAFLGLNVSPELRERVRAAARRADRTVSSWVRQTIRRRLDNGPLTEAEAKELAEALIEHSDGADA